MQTSIGEGNWVIGETDNYQPEPTEKMVELKNELLLIYKSK